MDNLALKTTSDGSTTLYRSDINEHYHSIHGAIQESEHVFIKNGLLYAIDVLIKPIRILEIGFGTGLNCLLAWKISNLLQKKISYLGLEPFSVPNIFIKKLNYCKNSEEQQIFDLIHNKPWNVDLKIDSLFSIYKSSTTFKEHLFKRRFNLVFFDAFAPRVENELWNLYVYKTIYNLLEDNGLLVTYCAKGSVRRDLGEAGFKIERLEGPPGKREMLRATKAGNDIQKQEVSLMG